MNNSAINRLREMVSDYNRERRGNEDRRYQRACISQRKREDEQAFDRHLGLINTQIDEVIKEVTKLRVIKVIVNQEDASELDRLTESGFVPEVSEIMVMYFMGDKYGSLEVLTERALTKLRKLYSIRKEHTKPRAPAIPCDEHDLTDYEGSRFCVRCGEIQECIIQPPFPPDHDDPRLTRLRKGETPIIPPELDDIDLENMTHKDLVRIARDCGVKYASDMDNDTLFAELGLPPEANRMKSTKPTGVTLTDVKTGDTQSFRSLSEVARMSGKNRGSIHYHIEKGKKLVIGERTFLVTKDKKGL